MFYPQNILTLTYNYIRFVQILEKSKISFFLYSVQTFFIIE